MSIRKNTHGHQDHLPDELIEKAIKNGSKGIEIKYIERVLGCLDISPITTNNSLLKRLTEPFNESQLKSYYCLLLKLLTSPRNDMLLTGLYNNKVSCSAILKATYKQSTTTDVFVPVAEYLDTLISLKSIKKTLDKDHEWSFSKKSSEQREEAYFLHIINNLLKMLLDIDYEGLDKENTVLGSQTMFFCVEHINILYQMLLNGLLGFTLTYHCISSDSPFKMVMNVVKTMPTTLRNLANLYNTELITSFFKQTPVIQLLDLTQLISILTDYAAVTFNSEKPKLSQVGDTINCFADLLRKDIRQFSNTILCNAPFTKELLKEAMLRHSKGMLSPGRSPRFFGFILGRSNSTRALKDRPPVVSSQTPRGSSQPSSPRTTSHPM